MVLSLVTSLLLAASHAGQDGAAIYQRSKPAIVNVLCGDGAGTGFAIGDGTMILTCDHVIKSGEPVTIEGESNQSAVVVFQDYVKDIAILKVRSKLAKTLEIYQGPTPQPGSRVYVIGNALGVLEYTITEGIVSGVRKTPAANLIQISAAVSPGNSGGPVLDSKGRVIGMVTGFREDGQNLNFAVSSYDLRYSLEAAKLATPPSSAPGSKKVLGKLGQARENTTVYASMSKSSQVYHRLKKLEFMVVLDKPRDNWVRILLQNGMSGYVPSESVTVLAYEVNTNAEAEPGRAPSDMGLLKSGRAMIVELAKECIGNRAVKNGKSLEKGVDNGAFVQLLYAKIDIKLPSSPAQQALIGQPITRMENLQAGDRVYFWGKKANKIDRTGIYLGNGYFVIANVATKKVESHYLGEKKWLKDLVASRR